MLKLTRKVNESVVITDKAGNHIVTVEVGKLGKGQVQLGFTNDATKTVISRTEILPTEPRAIDYIQAFGTRPHNKHIEFRRSKPDRDGVFKMYPVGSNENQDSIDAHTLEEAHEYMKKGYKLRLYSADSNAQRVLDECKVFYK